MYGSSIHGIVKHNASCILDINELVDNCEKMKAESVMRINDECFWIGKRLLRKTVRRGEQKMLNYLNSQTRIQTSFVGEKEIIAINSIGDKEVVDISFSLWNLYLNQQKMRRNINSDESSEDSSMESSENSWDKNLVIEKRLLSKSVKPKRGEKESRAKSGFKSWRGFSYFSRNKKIYTTKTEMDFGIQREKGNESSIRKMLCNF